jgi:hypothetical protein
MTNHLRTRQELWVLQERVGAEGAERMERAGGAPKVGRLCRETWQRATYILILGSMKTVDGEAWISMKLLGYEGRVHNMPREGRTETPTKHYLL